MNYISRLFVLTVSVFCVCNTFAHAESLDLEAVTDFLKLPDGWKLGNCSAVAVNSQGEIFLFHRGEHPLICFDKEGKYLRSWGDGVIEIAHGLRIDREDNVWTTDIGQHKVFKFDPQGKLLMSLGTGVAGDQKDQFNKPTDIAFGPKGEIYVTDGYGNSRVMKFSPSGGFIKSWGTLGKSPNQFNVPHSIVIDGDGRLLVGDRENNRIQIFNEEGKLLDIWGGFAPYGLAFNKDGELFVADGRANRVVRLNTAGKVQQSWGKKGKKPGQFDMPHMLGFDAEGNLFVAEVNGARLQKFAKK